VCVKGGTHPKLVAPGLPYQAIARARVCARVWLTAVQILGVYSQRLGIGVIFSFYKLVAYILTFPYRGFSKCGGLISC
jgi:hypothetical protein